MFIFIKINLNKKQYGITFKPKLNTIYNHSINNSLLERSQEFIENKRRKLDSMNSSEIFECTFSPKVNSSKINFYAFNNNQKESSVSDRLYKHKDILRAKLNLKKQKYKEHYSFKPTISKNTNKILAQKEKLLNVLKMQIEKDNKSRLSLLSNNQDKASNMDSYLADFDRSNYQSMSVSKDQIYSSNENFNNFNSLDSPISKRLIKQRKASSHYDEEEYDENYNWYFISFI